MTSTPDLASLYQLLAKEARPILPSGEQRAILGCGYVGKAVAKDWRQQGHELWGTTTSHERLNELAEFVDTPAVFNSADPHSNLAFASNLDGILVSFAPSRRSQVKIDQYRSTFLGGLELLINTLGQRSTNSPLQLVYLSSCGVYGNRHGALTYETDEVDTLHPVNEVLIKAEEMIQHVRSEKINVCVLRLGGIYGPSRDIPGMLLSASGGIIQRNGQNVPCWIHLVDIIRGVNFAFKHNLNEVYNLVDDTQYTGQELTDRLCEQAGLPLAKWLTVDTSDRVLNARVSNYKLKQLGFTLTHPSMVG
jgi:nucleoside-diphosphate-sugar epimerase